LIVIPHTKTRSRTLAFSKRTIRAAQGTALVLGLILLGVTADYVRLRLFHQDFTALRAENAKQREEISAYQSSVGDLERQLKVLADLAGKLNVMAGIKSPDAVPGFGFIGGPSDDHNQLSSAAPPPITSGQMQNVQQKAADIERNFGTLVNFFENKTAELAATPSIWPVRGWPSSGFQWRNDPFTGNRKFHFGLDIVASPGSPVVAPADGTIIAAASDNSLGNHVRILHGNGVTTIYGHLRIILVRVGQRVKRRDPIGEVGSTGMSIGPHLHYEVRKNDRAVNPYGYIIED
jgi:murein DD-endopeptidase MepM/ murein hydrolase activator NlpD